MDVTLNIMQTFTDPSLTEYEVEMQRMLRAECAPEEPPEATQLLQIVAMYKTEPHHDRYGNIACK